MDQTDTNETWATPSAPPEIGGAPRVRFTPPPPAQEPAYAGLGTRATALIIDLLLALVVVVPLAALSDGISSSNGLLRIKLSGPPLLLAMVLWVAYMTLMEGKYGASLGKRATRLRVVTEDGLPIDLEAALIRNVLRFLDAFPYVVPYLLGAIVAGRSPLKQRFGDRVAETIVVSHVAAEQPAAPAPYERPVPQAAPRAAPQAKPPAKPPASVAGPSPSAEMIEPPARRFRLRVVLIPLLVLALIAAGGYVFMSLRGGCSVAEGIYDCHGVGFSYPSGWSAIDDVRIVPPGNPEFVDIVGLDQLNNVQLHGFRMSRPVDDSNVKQFKRQLLGASDLIAAVVSGEVTHTPTRVEVGGLEGFRVQVEGAIGDQAVTFTGFALLQGTTEYFLACVSTPDHARDIRQGCQQVMRTFHLS
jgi:uncharacterized RDD family membrane protein YckC